MIELSSRNPRLGHIILLRQLSKRILGPELGWDKHLPVWLGHDMLDAFCSILAALIGSRGRFAVESEWAPVAKGPALAFFFRRKI